MPLLNASEDYRIKDLDLDAEQSGLVPWLWEVPAISTNAMFEMATQAATDAKPFSFIRLVDHEYAVMTYPGSDFDVNTVTCAYPVNWHLEAETVERMKVVFVIATRNADIVGTIADPAGTRKRTAAMEAFFAPHDVRPARIGWAFDFRCPERFVNGMRALVSGRDILCAGFGAAEWGATLQQKFGAMVHVWPFADPCINDWAKYEQVRAWMAELAAPGRILLAGLGPWAICLCDDAKREGMVALDLGAGLRGMPHVY